MGRLDDGLSDDALRRGTGEALAAREPFLRLSTNAKDSRQARKGGWWSATAKLAGRATRLRSVLPLQLRPNAGGEDGKRAGPVYDQQLEQLCKDGQAIGGSRRWQG
mgnify:CR=1 FL=1